MPTNLSGKNVVLGVTGSIAAYKAADLTSRLVKEGARVNVILSASAAKLIGPLTFAGLTHRQVITDLFEPTSEMGMDHISLAKQADLIIVAPCTANTVARIAHGGANDALTTTILATEAPVLIAPAGDAHMFVNETVLANIKLLKMLEAIPHMGKIKSRRLLEELKISEKRRLRGVGKLQRERLLERFS